MISKKASNVMVSGDAPERRAAASRRLFVFLFLFVLFVVVGSLLLSQPWVKAGFVEPWTRFNAAGSAAFARMLGVEARADGTQVSYGHGTLNILTGCNGVEALLILLSALLAFPSSWRRRLLGALGGTIAILGVNLLRLVSLIVIANSYPQWLELFHVYVWQTLIVLIAFGFFSLWGMFFAHARPVTQPSRTA